MFLESCNRAFSSVDLVIVGVGKVDVHVVGSDLGFNGIWLFVVHDVNRGCIPMAVEGREDLYEGSIHRPIIVGIRVFGRHGADKDSIEIINIHHKHRMHVMEWTHREGACAISVHCPGVQVGKACEAKHVVCQAYFLCRLESINVGTGLHLQDCWLLRPHRFTASNAHTFFIMIGYDVAQNHI
jgi:hypothetical protein